MPCHISPTSVLETRISRHAIWSLGGQVKWAKRFHAYPAALQPQTPFRFVDSTRPNAEEEQEKRRTLERLDKVIDPHDLSATLEAHRDVNRASIIRQIHTEYTDENLVRPSFLKDQPFRRIQSSNNVDSTPSEATDESNSLPERVIKKVPGLSSNVAATDMLWSRVERKPENLRVQTSLPSTVYKRLGHPMEEQRRKFLELHEKPRQPMSDNIRDRLSCFDTMRRVRRVIQIKQNAIKSGGRIKDAIEYLLEYEGHALGPKASTQDHNVREPWATAKREPNNQTRQQRLDEDISAFTKWMEPTPSEEAARAAIYKDMLSIIEKTIPNARAELFGSQATGLAMPLSDIDIRVFPQNSDLHFQRNPDLDTREAKSFLRSLNGMLGALRAHPDYTRVTMLHGRYPLISATHASTGLTLQLVASPDTSASRDCMRAYLAEFPNLKPLYMIVKTSLDMRGLTDVWYGGLGSYSVFMMVVASLKHHRSTNNPKDDEPVSKQLLDFLYFYGTLDMYQWGVGVEPVRLFAKKSIAPRLEMEEAKRNLVLEGQHFIQRPFYYQRYMLCLQDPADPFNDLGMKSFAIKDIQATLKAMHSTLHVMLTVDVAGRKPMTLLKRLVGRCDQIYDETRVKLDLFGDNLLTSDKEAE